MTPELVAGVYSVQPWVGICIFLCLCEESPRTLPRTLGVLDAGYSIGRKKNTHKTTSERDPITAVDQDYTPININSGIVC